MRLPSELISLLGAQSDCIVQVMKPLYCVPEAGNHWFATYYKHYIEKLGMTESTYDPCLFYRSYPLGIVGMQSDEIFILADDVFASNKEGAIKEAKMMIYDHEYLSYTQPIKFNRAQIKLNLDGIVLTKESHIGGILLVKRHDVNSTSSRGITRTKLSPKEQYMTQKARSVYIASVCQPDTSFDLSISP